MEIWKDIAGYEGLYQVSNMGRVRSLDRFVRQMGNGTQVARGRIRKLNMTRYYLQVGLCKDGNQTQHYVHRLVASAFIPNDDLFANVINHKNEVKTDNRVENLEWVSQAYNVKYSLMGPCGKNSGSRCYRARKVRCIETGEVFLCAKDASRWLGLSKHAVSSSIHRGGTCGGYHWEFV